MPAPIYPMLWFDGAAEQAAEFYCGIFPNSRIESVSRYSDAGPGEAGAAMTVAFELNGTRFVGLNGGPQFSFTEAVSFVVGCDGQDEVDYYWDHLVDGGQEGQCGWLKDRFGVSWQIVPAGLEQLLGDPDAGRAQRAMAAMLGMRKLDLAAMRRAADEVPVG
jgi:predicted 3-demethylubiquinone-9 3-methyltransferase (glyoxalase superfamily)